MGIKTRYMETADEQARSKKGLSNQPLGLKKNKNSAGQNDTY